MASSRTKDYGDDDDIISYCGSMSGETFSSRRRRNNCSIGHHSIHSLAKRLQEQNFDPDPDPLKRASISTKPKFNKSFYHFRFIVVMLGGLSVGTMFLLRYNITVSILRMVNQTHLYMEEHPDKTVDDFLAEGYSLGGEFNWNNEIQHMIMSWYMVAYTLPQVPFTKLGLMLGIRMAVPISLGLCGISTLLTPMFAYFGWEHVIFLRLINGLGASVIFPMLLCLVESWMPYDEMTLGLTVAQSIVAICTASNPLIAGYLSSIHWKYSFYVPGFCTLGLCVAWLILVTDRPENNFFISERELEHICCCKKTNNNNQNNKKSDDCVKNNKETDNNATTNQQSQHKAITIEPNDESIYRADSWVDIFKVPAFYAYMLIWCFYCSSYSGFSFIMPTYLRQFLKIKVAQNGLYGSIIQSGCFIAATWPQPFLSFLQNRMSLSITAARRITHVLLCSIVALTWIYVGTFHETQVFILFLNRCAHNSNDIVVTGCLMANFAKAGLSSLAFSMVNTVGNLSVVFTSTFVGWLLDYTGQSRQAWTWIFDGLGISQWIMCLLFLTFINSKPIKFRKAPPNENTPSENLAENIQNANATSNVIKTKEVLSLNNFARLANASNEQSETSEEGTKEHEHNESRQI